MRHLFRIVLLLLLTAPALTAMAPAQPVPDAGRTLEDLRRPSEPQAPPVGLTIERVPLGEAVPAGGEQVVLQEVSLAGMTRFDAATLRRALGAFQGQSYDLAGLNALAEKLTRYYRERGYPFALAYLPPQQVDAGLLRIEILEGHYGEIRVSGTAALAKGARPFLAGLKPGAAIETAPLERAISLLGDQPGVRIAPLLMPGQAVGSGDLQVEATAGERLNGELSLDNHGNRHTGAWRTHLRSGLNRLFRFGDRLSFDAMLTDEQLWHGRLGYELPLGGTGLRAHAGYTHSHYELGGDFAALDATGTAKMSNLGLSYPLLRSARANLRLQLDYRYKDLQDKTGGGTSQNKSSHSLPLTLQFDRRDAIAGGGVSWGTLAGMAGKLNLADSQLQADEQTARSDGTFYKLNLELARLQHLPVGFSLYGRFAGQWADGNLDSSEDFGLGGADGVRAWPQGEAYGDKGWLTQVELRYPLGPVTPYAFYDSGAIRINADPWAAGENERGLTGGGAGLRLTTAHWNFDASAAWRAWGGEPQADTKGDQPRFWVSAGYRF